MEILETLQAQNAIAADVALRVTEAVAEGASVEAALLAEGVAADLVRNTFGAEYGIPVYEKPEQVSIDNAVLELIPEESARHYGVVPLKIIDGVLQVAVNEPENIQIREVLNFVSTRHHMPYKLVFVLKEELDLLLSAYESLTGEVGQALTSLEEELDTEIAAKQKESGQDGQQPQTEHIEEDAPVTKIVATVLRYAVDGGASDIHIEPFQEKVRVRFRVDGHLQTSLQLPKNVQSAVVARVKILSSMRLDERRRPQDGRFSATFDGRKIDFRVSVLPTSGGEKVVMRILDSSKGVHTLEGAGISPYNLEIMRQVTQEPYGIVLVSGPTGSGKSTTLYSMLEQVDKEGKNVLSLEDPVEYDIQGVAQSQVRPEIGYTFAAGLRSALRQDPDIILVGEIRDKETAQLAIQAALTGHLVFSTIHTNNSIGVIPRLIDMGVDPYLIAPTLKLAVAQRLARRICPGSGVTQSTDGAIGDSFNESFSTIPKEYHERIPKSDTVMRLESTESCPSGTKGRVAITECLLITDKIEALILQNASEEDIYTEARKGGFMTMHEDAMVKALEHVIPYEEVGIFSSKVGATSIIDDPEEELMPPLPPIPEEAPPATIPPVDNEPPSATPTV